MSLITALNLPLKFPDLARTDHGTLLAVFHHTIHTVRTETVSVAVVAGTTRDGSRVQEPQLQSRHRIGLQARRSTPANRN
jgi:hypothetical protein